MMSVQMVAESLREAGHQEQTENLENLSNQYFSNIVCWILKEISSLTPIESCVSPLTVQDESSVEKFCNELDSALNEFDLPCSTNQLQDNKTKLIILQHLLGELFALQLLNVEQGQEEMELDQFQQDPVEDVRSILCNLDLHESNLNEQDPDKLFAQIQSKVNQLQASNKMKKEEDSLFLLGNSTFNEKQWKMLEHLEQKLITDYSLRKQMLITRCECTIGSFKWKKLTGSDAKDSKKTSNDDRLKQIDLLYSEAKYNLLPTMNVGLADALACRRSDLDDLINSKISQSHQTCVIVPPENTGMANAGRQQRLSLHKFIIGQVPDRGGRPEEGPRPSKESFSQQNRGRGGFSRGNFHNHGNRGGHQQQPQFQNQNRIQGAGWNQTVGDNRARQFHQVGGEQHDQSYSGNRQDQWDGRYDNRNIKRGRRGGGRGGY